jgi:hypothetical protein
MAAVALSSPSKAIAAARQYEGDKSLPANAVFARVTIEATLPPLGESGNGYANVNDVPAWVVTFTLREAVNGRLGGPVPQPGASASSLPPLMMTHDNVIIDAQTGQLIWGFFTK